MRRNAECRVLFTIMLNIIMLSIVMLSIVTKCRSVTNNLWAVL